MFSIPNDARILAIGAHPDDIELGAGGLIMRAIQERGAHVRPLIFTSGIQHTSDGKDFNRAEEARHAATLLGISAEELEIHNFEARGLNSLRHQLIHEVEKELIKGFRGKAYDLILTHAPHDTHQDHRQVSVSTISAARYFSGTMLLYQAPSTIPNEFHPTFFVNLDGHIIRAKDSALKAHVSQRVLQIDPWKKEYMSKDVIEGMAKAWALFHRMPNRYLEAFEVYKSFWQLAGSE